MTARSLVLLVLGLLSVAMLDLRVGHGEAAAAPVGVRRPALTQPRPSLAPLLKIVFTRQRKEPQEVNGVSIPWTVTDICVARHSAAGATIPATGATTIQTIYTEPGNSCGGPRWSPDGQRIVFHGTGLEPGNFDTHISIMREDGGDLQQLTVSELDDSGPAWSPDGERIVWSREGDLWTMNADGSDAALLLAEEGTRYASPDWSPDGTRILCTAMDASNTPLIRVLQADGSGVTPVPVYGTSGVMQPRWSPDGERIVVYSYVGRYWFLYGYFKYYGMYVLDADGSDGRWLVRPQVATDCSWTSPDWAPDGRTIICVRDSDVAQLKWINPDDYSDALLLTPDAIASRGDVSGVDVYVPEGTTAGSIVPVVPAPRTMGPRIQR